MLRLLIVYSLTLFLGACSMFGHNSDVKEPAYTLLKQESAFEVRQYPQIVMVTTSSSGDFKAAQNQSFNKLFDYISGKNAASTSIPMTAPVFMQPKAGTKIPMTAPVFMENTGTGWSMSFVLPAEYALASAPKPLDETLNLEERKNVKYAVVKFNGLFTEKNFEEKSQELRRWMEKHKLKAAGAPVRAGYNPPWTLPPLRRNEVLIPIK